MSEVVLEGDALCKRYHDGEIDVEVLRGVSLQVRAGETLAIVGASGSGKSTLLHLLGALDAPTSGRVVVKGRDLATLDAAAQGRWRNAQLGFVYQFHHLLPEFSAEDNVAMPLIIRREPAAAARERARALLAQIGLAARVAHRPAELSGGERQRVALGRALLSKPRLLLLDEPLGSLDEGRKVEILPYLVRLRDEANVPMVYVSHDPAELRQLATQIVMLRNGRVTALGGVKVLTGTTT
jgi:lipoprotein-releasing system ATP-binding protein